MTGNSPNRIYKRKLTPLERWFYLSPYAAVTLTARIEGEVTEGMLAAAVRKVQGRHPNLRCRVTQDEGGAPWLTSEGAQAIPVEVARGEGRDAWVRVAIEAGKEPYEFERRPAIRFILVKSPEPAGNSAEVVILCHHILCDGLSLAFLARDLMRHLGDPEREVEALPDPAPIGAANLPENLALNPIQRFFIRRINRRWAKEKIAFDQEDYRQLAATYWQHFDHRMVAVEFSAAETAALVERCRSEAVTVNSALTAAFDGAQSRLQGERQLPGRIAIAGSVRDRLPKPAGEAMGFYAGGVTLEHKTDPKVGFWENARRLHRRAAPLYTQQKLLAEILVYLELDPAIMESLPFKMVGGLVPPELSRQPKLSAFSRRADVIASILKREGMDSFENTLIRTAVTNLTRMDFPRQYGGLRLERLFLKPGGAYPLALVNLVVGAVTCSGRLSLVLEYAEGTIGTRRVEKIRDRALDWLLS